MPEERLLVDDRPDRVVVTLNRPQTRNAVDLEMGTALHEVCACLERTAKPMLLAGGDGYFAAGADIEQLLARGREDALAGINSALFERVHRLPMPTVAAIDGYALGGGAELAYACDVRIATSRVRFANPEPDLGIIAGAGATWRLRELVGEPLAKQVLLAGFQIESDRALSSGLVAEIVESGELLDRAHAIIDRMAQMSQIALRLTKFVLDAPGPHPASDLLANAMLFEDEEKYSRMRTFLERRAQRSGQR